LLKAVSGWTMNTANFPISFSQPSAGVLLLLLKDRRDIGTAGHGNGNGLCAHQDPFRGVRP
jgi:hypothetical protein